MPRCYRPLLIALACSLAAHLAPFAVDWLSTRPAQAKPPATPSLQATLRQPHSETLIAPPAPAATRPPVDKKPEPMVRQPAPTEKKPSFTVDREKPAKTWNEAVARQFAKQRDQGLFYPEEAIRRGLQGTPLVLMVIDAEGNVTAARIEESCGHDLLDQAALRAVRALRALPADAPREVLLPVRFRLR